MIWQTRLVCGMDMVRVEGSSIRGRVLARASPSSRTSTHLRRPFCVLLTASREEAFERITDLPSAIIMTEPKFPWFRWSIASVARTPHRPCLLDRSCSRSPPNAVVTIGYAIMKGACACQLRSFMS